VPDCVYFTLAFLSTKSVVWFLGILDRSTAFILPPDGLAFGNLVALLMICREFAGSLTPGAGVSSFICP
jgi:hypothetical protein